MSSLTPPQAPPSWSFTNEEILSKTEQYIKEGKELDDLIASKLDAPTIDNVFKPFVEFGNRYDGLINQLTFLQHVSSDSKLRDSSLAAEEKIREFGIESGLRVDVFKVFNKLWTENENNDKLNHETKKYLKKINTEFKRNGLNLPEETREEIKKIQKELSTLSLQFSKNLGENVDFIKFTKEELNGVPSDVVDQFDAIEEDGVTYHKMTFKYPDLFPVLKYSKDPNTRKRAFLGDQNKVPQNEELLKNSVILRDELSTILGYDNFANYILEEKMAKNSTIVFKFLNDLQEKLQPLGAKEIEILKDLKKDELQLPKHNEVDYFVWDHRYYDNLYLEREFQVNQEAIAEYFPLKTTIAKMLNFYEKLFNLKFVESETTSAWHEDVKQFAVWQLDGESPEFKGWLYMDLHPRDGKYGHAANFGLYSGFSDFNETRNYPVTALVCNFSKPTKEKPSLLKHDEVVTLYHECGHGLHDILGNVQYAKFHGPSASKWDFVEAPSQFLEYFCWSKDLLKSFSNHYKTNEQLPDDLTESLIKSKHVNGGLFNLRQLHFGLFDMKLHTSKTEVDISKLWNKLRQEIALVSNGNEISKGYNSFNHIMGGYQAGYYGYLWSQVFAADIYYTLFKNNENDLAKSGKKYRDIILARGGAYDENDNLKELLGRDPNNNAFSQELGLEN
ncbi:hypothetical protein WICMUC_004300 [Wickerhamomyces mucosus]|uniref:Peptidase M3A/M3B catalytic domain-containing protein n=1 Tax=Wickerhamomyces mucosus TaxID=1378264 RepID=A0A9P8PJA0_9ASCO|nr:hypothetical protein WICMUC_004300 [Wickerhamomyces mucosus]